MYVVIVDMFGWVTFGETILERRNCAGVKKNRGRLRWWWWWLGLKLSPIVSPSYFQLILVLLSFRQSHGKWIVN